MATVRIRAKIYQSIEYEKRSYWQAGFMLAFLIVALVSLLINPHWWILAWISLFALVFAILPIIMFWMSHDLQHLGIAAPILMTWLYFLAPYLYPNFVSHGYRIMPLEYLPEMSLAAGLSICALFVGYYLTFASNEYQGFVPPIARLSTRTLQYLFWFFMAGTVLQRFLNYYASSIETILTRNVFPILDYAPILTLCVGLILILRGERARIIDLLTLLLGIFEVLLRTSETLFSKTAFLIIALLTVFVVERRRIPLFIIVFVFLIAFPIFNNRFTYRYDAVDRWFAQSSQEEPKIWGLVQLGLVYLQDSIENFKWDKIGDAVLEQASTRLENVTLLGQLVAYHEIGGKSFKLGSTFWWLPFTPIPRAVFPWKPINDLATTTATEYGLRQETNHNAVNFPILAEAYINYGFIGMVVISFFQGMLYKWSLRKIHFGYGDYNLLILITFLWQLYRVEANITLIFGAIFQLLINWWILYKLLTYRRLV